ncbi:acyltransferase [Caulobacter sp. UNC279MFTsu5.1]|uniref:acyltransferase family protein n=1 Tax=Caulobacter sp. UNC279MFTsu5.1 TaxID=1502775 RepID=UPI00035F2E8C|nr:acyltransferase [Caulobacter sp. UNC279MFTsu5.1]SFI94203.1 Peptidoglycan/LPS O-acetylase OafA/YrhL, contains acyltransferase and SGNH-hydrolase domains [Caulobacter sp. UNC279MFTsu5.1]
MSFTTRAIAGLKAAFGPSPGDAAPRAVGPDLLRACAILLVMLQHLPKAAAADWLILVKPYGWLGVDVFFVLSGYLIGGQLMRPIARGEAPDLLRFWASRAFRILPAYLVILALYNLLPGFTDGEGLQPLWRFLTFTMNLGLDYTRTGNFSSAWSLCVEEWFYLTLPLLVLGLRLPALRRAGPWPGVGLAAVLVLGGMALRFWLWRDLSTLADPPPGLYQKVIYYPTWCRLDGLLMGVLLAALRTFRPARWARLCPPWLAAPAAVALWAAAIRLIGDNGLVLSLTGATVVYPLYALGCALMLSALLDLEPWLARQRPRGLAPLAALAYSLYLVHKPVYWALYDRLGPEVLQGWTGLALYVLPAFAAAIVLHVLVERPFLRLRDRVMARPVEAGEPVKLAA